MSLILAYLWLGARACGEGINEQVIGVNITVSANNVRLGTELILNIARDVNYAKNRTD